MSHKLPKPHIFTSSTSGEPSYSVEVSAAIGSASQKWEVKNQSTFSGGLFAFNQGIWYIKITSKVEKLTVNNIYIGDVSVDSDMEVENNDSKANATYIFTGKVTWGSHYDAQWEGKSSGTVVDWYQIHPSKAGKYVIGFDTAQPTALIEVMDKSGKVLKRAKASSGTQKKGRYTVELGLKWLESATYYIKVSEAFSSSVPSGAGTMYFLLFNIDDRDLDPSCAVVRNDGKAWRCNAKGEPISSEWTYETRRKVRKVFIASDVVSTIKDVTCDMGSGDTSCYSLDVLFDNLEVVEFLLDKSGKSSTTSIASNFLYCAKQLKQVINLEKTSVVTIGEDAFGSCPLLFSISVPKSLQTIGEDAFSDDTSLTTLKGLEKTQLASIGEYAFSDCTLLKTLDIPKTCKSIGGYAFSGCTSLEKITVRTAILPALDYDWRDRFEDTPIANSSTGRIYVPYIVIKKNINKADDEWKSLKKKMRGIPGTEIDISNATVSGVVEKFYDGKAKTQNPVVTVQGIDMVKGADFTISYKNNKSIGTASMTITGKGAFKGSKTVKFKISKAPVFNFKDVPSNHWASGVIKRAASLGLIAGYSATKFGPEDNITRGQVAVILWRMAGKPTAGNGAKSFYDVKSGAYYYDAVRWARAASV